ncbi:response regulator [Belnapia rosea]|uniref:Response regulator receiver domain-containing protein n=1 Tax=Belnapia rosea TaxID=938405 RepID=A0A1G7CXJ4_9PROT|nr:response regulator [Belnapia rosea]SDB73087.1 Response regulator receiver domain-containing protein [Belnapia rosea]SDE44062.1 Response regulator receiver domain-containing protein [Belnapia rosea]
MTYKVLVVDDSKLARMVVAKALSTGHPDWMKAEAANAAEAMDLASRSPFDAALLDFNMPGQDGLHLAAELRALYPRMALGLLSANHQVEIVSRAHEVGATFLPKPLAQQDLSDFLAKAVQLKAATR